MAIELWLDTSKYKIRSLPCITSVNPSFNLSPLSKRETLLRVKTSLQFCKVGKCLSYFYKKRSWYFTRMISWFIDFNSGVTHNEMISLWCKATKETMIDQWL